MKKLLVTMALLALGACTDKGRYMITDSDVAAREQAQKAGMDHWVDTEQTSHALTCVSDSGPPFYTCLVWDRNPPSGAFDCTSDTTAYSGEILFFDTSPIVSTTNCAGFNEANRTSLAALGDYNDVVMSVKNNSSNSVNLYEHSDFGGAMLQTIWVGGNQLQGVTSSNNAYHKVSSIRRN